MSDIEQFAREMARFIDTLNDALASAHDRIGSLEGRLERMHRYGTVAEVDAEKQRVRMRVGGSDEEPHLTPWIPYTQHAGAMKDHWVPSKGQQMVCIAPDGSHEQSYCMPLTWSKDNSSPSKSADEGVRTFGDYTRTIKKSGRKIDLTDAFHTVMKGGFILHGVKDLDHFKFKIDDKWYRLADEAIKPTSKPPDF